jgi:hypothetical protein
MENFDSLKKENFDSLNGKLISVKFKFALKINPPKLDQKNFLQILINFTKFQKPIQKQVLLQSSHPIQSQSIKPPRETKNCTTKLKLNFNGD